METGLESKKQNVKENLEQAISVERERFTQMQLDMEELRTKCAEMEFRFKAEQVVLVCTFSYSPGLENPIIL